MGLRAASPVVIGPVANHWGDIDHHDPAFPRLFRLPGRSHHFTANTFITSSPRWLITFTAIRPDFGLAKGREVSEYGLSQAAWPISAFSVSTGAQS